MSISLTPDIGRIPRKTKTFRIYQNTETKRWGFDGAGSHKCVFYTEESARQGIRDFCLNNNITVYQVVK